MNNKEITIADTLAELGLTSEESSVYTLLLARGGLTAKAIGTQLGRIVNSVYRSTNALTIKGLIKELDVTPKQFQAIPPSIAIKYLAVQQVERVHSVSQTAIRQLEAETSPNNVSMGVMTGREELFEEFVRLAKKAKEEILVISIGEPVPESIWSVTKEALERGVTTKFVFHKNDKENVMLIKRWRAMGVPVRYLPNEGYHLNIFDHSAAILSASNPKQSKERTGIVIYNEAIIEALRMYFFQQWESAKPV
jgi:sugar-specific transcriptional regulator TrmB